MKISEMNADDFMQFLKRNDFCKKDIRFAQGKSAMDFWNTCKRGDYLLWLLFKAKIDIKTLIGLKVKVVRLIEHLITNEISLKALNVGELFSQDLATRKQLDEAYAVATAYANDAHAYADNTHAYAYDNAAAYDAAAYAASYAVAYDSYTIAAAEIAAHAVAYLTGDYCKADKIEMQLKQSNLIRENFDFNTI